VWDNVTQLEKIRKVDKIFEPDMAQAKRDELLDGWKRAAQKARSVS
jgi:glycerol kinase